MIPIPIPTAAVRLRGLELTLALTVAAVAAGPAAASPHVRRHARPRAHAHPHRPRGSRPGHHRMPAAHRAVRRIGVSFSVVNRNGTAVACGADGRTYTVAGTLILPASGRPAGVTLYAHGFGYAGYFWHFTAVPGYDYATAEAQAGHASLVIDRLGYGGSSVPPGTASCVGSQATVLHEIVQELRTGSYVASGTSAPAFSRVGLVGHSAGGELVEVEAYTFHDIDALGVVEWADQSYSVGTYAAFGGDAIQCAAGGNRQVGSTSTGYAEFGSTASQYDALMFHDAAPAVVAAANSRRTLDPCGQIESVLTGVGLDVLDVSAIRVPIAYVHAGQDAIFTIGLPWPQLQEALYRSAALTDISLPGEGHAVTLERAAPRFEAAMSAWLGANRL